jgi:hypothetical protein
MTTTLTEEQKVNQLADNVVMREREIHQYQVNIDNYTTMLANLPAGEWPENLAKYKGFTSQQVAKEVPDANIDEVSDLIFRDQVAMLLKTENIEKRKAQRVYDALVGKIAPNELASRLEAAVARSI